MTCSIDSCDNTHYGRGWCAVHYERWRRNGDVDAGRPVVAKRPGGGCSVDDCDRPHSAGGLCASHRARLRRHGDPLGGRGYNGDGTVSRYGYRLINVDGKQVFEHRYVMEQELGRPLEHREQVHHIDGDRLNNALDNLMVLPLGEHQELHAALKRGVNR